MLRKKIAVIVFGLLTDDVFCMAIDCNMLKNESDEFMRTYTNENISNFFKQDDSLLQCLPEVSLISKTVIANKFVDCVLCDDHKDESFFVETSESQCNSEITNYHRNKNSLNINMQSQPVLARNLQNRCSLNANTQPQKRQGFFNMLDTTHSNSKKSFALIDDNIFLVALNQIKDINPFIGNRIILSVDGGGSRGYIPLNIVSEIITKYRNKINLLLDSDADVPMPLPIDLYAGTSVGAYVCLSVLLDKTKKTLNTFPADFRYIFKKPSCSMCFPKYNNNNRKKVFTNLTTVNHCCDKVQLTGKMLSNKYGVDFFSTYVDLSQGKLLRYHSKDNDTRNILLSDILLMTSAAPTIFPAYENNDIIVIDGGVGANNPALLAYLHDKKIKETLNNNLPDNTCATTRSISNPIRSSLYITKQATLDNSVNENNLFCENNYSNQYAAKTVVISLGTGEPAKDYIKSYTFKKAGCLKWAAEYPNMSACVSNGIMTNIVNDLKDLKMFRLQPKLKSNLMRTDQKSKKSFKCLKTAADGLLDEQSVIVDEIVYAMCFVTIERLLYIHKNLVSVDDVGEIFSENDKPFLREIANIFIKKELYHLSIDNLFKVKAELLSLCNNNK